MRGRIKVGLVALSVTSLLAVLGRVGVTAALDNPPPAAEVTTAVEKPAPADFGPPPFAEPILLADVSAAAFGPPPSPNPFARDEPVLLTRDQLRERGTRDRRDRLVRLASEVTSLASDAELDALVAQLETVVAEKRAEAELRQAQESLERVVAAFPQTGAADAARKMLDRKPEPPAAPKLTPVEAPR